MEYFMHTKSFESAYNKGKANNNNKNQIQMPEGLCILLSDGILA